MLKLIEQARHGRKRAIARLISQVERSQSAAAEIVAAVYSHTGHAHVVGITGAPGSGKSSLVTEVAKAFRQLDKRVGIIAVDPTSPFTGGALLGDRVRMQELSGDAGVFIRSMATRGSLGGLAEATSAAVKILDAAGFDIILVETVGAGQSEVDIARAAHTTLVIEAPGMGDAVQSIKAGILEIADILVVNKADKPGASNTIKALRAMLGLGPKGGTRHHGRILESDAIIAKKAEDEQAWQVPVLPVSALKIEGVDALVETINNHLAHLKTSSQWLDREKERSESEVEQLLLSRVLAQFKTAVSAEEKEALIAAVAQRKIDPYSAASKLFEKI